MFSVVLSQFLYGNRAGFANSYSSHPLGTSLNFQSMKDWHHHVGSKKNDNKQFTNCCNLLNNKIDFGCDAFDRPAEIPDDSAGTGRMSVGRMHQYH